MSLNKLTLDDVDVTGKRVLMRVDFNVTHPPLATRGFASAAPSPTTERRRGALPWS